MILSLRFDHNAGNLCYATDRTTSRKLHFHNLRHITLSLVLFEGDCQHQFFKALGKAKLEYINISGIEYAPSMQKLQRILSAICDHCDHDTLRILIMCISPDNEGDFDWVDEIQSGATNLVFSPSNIVHQRSNRSSQKQCQTYCIILSQIVS
jgi:hypothetical protein